MALKLKFKKTTEDTLTETQKQILSRTMQRQAIFLEKIWSASIQEKIESFDMRLLQLQQRIGILEIKGKRG